MISFILQRDATFLLLFKTFVKWIFFWVKKKKNPSAVRGLLTRHCWSYTHCNLVTRSPSSARGVFPGEYNVKRLLRLNRGPFPSLAGDLKLGGLTPVLREVPRQKAWQSQGIFLHVPPTSLLLSSKPCELCKPHLPQGVTTTVSHKEK